MYSSNLSSTGTRNSQPQLPPTTNSSMSGVMFLYNGDYANYYQNAQAVVDIQQRRQILTNFLSPFLDPKLEEKYKSFGFPFLESATTTLWNELANSSSRRGQLEFLSSQLKSYANSLKEQRLFSLYTGGSELIDQNLTMEIETIIEEAINRIDPEIVHLKDIEDKQALLPIFGSLGEASEKTPDAVDALDFIVSTFKENKIIDKDATRVEELSFVTDHLKLYATDLDQIITALEKAPETNEQESQLSVILAKRGSIDLILSAIQDDLKSLHEAGLI